MLTGSRGSMPCARASAAPFSPWIDASRKWPALSWRSTNRALAEQRTHSASNRMTGPPGASSAIAKQSMLVHQFAKQGVRDLEVEGEAPAAEMLVRDHRLAGRDPAGEAQPQAAGLPEIMVGGEDQRVGLGAHGQRHAEAAPDMLLQPRRPGEALGAVAHLRAARLSAVEARPKLSAAAAVLADRDRRRGGAA